MGGVCSPCWNVREPTEDDADRGYVEANRPLETLCSEVEPHLGQHCVAGLGRRSPAAVTQPLARAAWITVPGTCLVCEEDMAIVLPLQEAMAEHAPADPAAALGALVVPAAAGRLASWTSAAP
ncbi:hypothetical protein ABZ904_46670 [Streptomyces sp. NPDC046900]|uniref:hypothetical protein n=1 Tax=Streptomyces sp. NPDC046900 TaxID=3155473 RepID=UPI0033FE98CE